MDRLSPWTGVDGPSATENEVVLFADRTHAAEQSLNPLRRCHLRKTDRGGGAWLEAQEVEPMGLGDD